MLLQLFITLLKRIRVVASPFQTLHAGDDGVDILVAQGFDELLELVLVHVGERGELFLSCQHLSKFFKNFVFELREFLTEESRKERHDLT